MNLGRDFQEKSRHSLTVFEANVGHSRLTLSCSETQTSRLPYQFYSLVKNGSHYEIGISQTGASDLSITFTGNSFPQAMGRFKQEVQRRLPRGQYDEETICSHIRPVFTADSSSSRRVEW